MKKNLLLLGVFALISLWSFAQDFSNKGKEFWLAYSYHVGMAATSSGPPTMTLNMTSDVNTTYTVEIYGGAVISTGSITANAVTTITIPTTYFVNDDGLFNQKAIHVTAAKPIIIYAFQTRAQATGATLCLPVNVLGKQYYAMSFTQNSNEPNSNGYITIVAVEDNTNVEIIPTALTKAGWLANSVHTVSLNKGQVYQVLGQAGTNTGTSTGSDLSGTSIRSIASGSGGCKRIAVFSGSGKLFLGCSSGSADNLYQQLYPVATWGKKYLTVPSYNRPVNFYRIMRSDPAAIVKLNGTIIPAASFTNGYYQFVGNVPNLIESDLPICVTQYFTSAGCNVTGFPVNSNPNPYDPDMIVLNPVEQNISKVTLISSNLTGAASGHQHNLHVVIRNSGTGISSFRFDGAPLPATSVWTVHPQDANYSYVYIPNIGETSHSLQSDSGFNALAYGYANAETYGYSAGTNVKDLYQQISVATQYGIETSPSVCTGSPFRFKISLPYKPLSLAWNLNGLSTAGTTPATFSYVQNPDPACTQYGPPYDLPTDNSIYACPDSIRTVNGKPIYWFSIPIYYNITNTGTYPISIIAQTSGTDGCGSEQEINFDLEVSNPPVADFTFNTPGCIADTVRFLDNTSTVKPNYHWYWDFDDPGSGALNHSNAQNPIHIFTTPGPHVVRFASITTPGCLSDTLNKTVNVPAMPSATVTGTTAVCQNAPGQTITFTGTDGTPPYTFTYNINGGAPQTISTTGAATSVTVTAPTATAGTFVYNLTNVKNTPAAFCTTNITGQAATVTVNPLPTATISGTTAVCQNATQPNITFTGANGTAPYTFTYHIGAGPDLNVQTTTGNSVTVAAPTNVTGTFTYTLTAVTDGSATLCNNTASGTATVTVNPLPTATITGTTELCKNAAGPTITFTGAGGTAPYIFTYDVNGAAPTTISSDATGVATLTAPTTTAGTYVYTLHSVQESTVPTNCSQNQAGSATVIVDPLPTASFTTVAPYCESKNVTFTPAFSVSSGTVTSWVWDYDDGTGTHTRPDGNPFTVLYTTTGVKHVTFKTISDKGCESALFSQDITINAKPEAGFINPEVCLLDPFAQFNDTSKVAAPGTIATWEWTFADPNATVGNPNTSNSQNPTHVYTQVGTYNVELIVTSNFGCKDTVFQNVIISDGNPQANFIVQNAANLCSNDTVRIQNKSTIASGVITRVQIYWDFLNQPAVFDNDPDPLFDKIYKHKYPTAATDQNYTIRMRSYSGNLCFSEKTIVVTVHAAPIVQLNDFPDVCLNNGTVQFTQGSETGGVAGPPGVYSGTGVSASGLFNPLTAGVGTHPITYTFTSNFGCTESKTKNVKVLEAPVAAFATVGTTCQNSTITFSQSSTSNAGTIAQWIYHWGDGSADETFTNGGNQTHTYTITGSVTATLTVVTDYGCKSLPKPLTFNVNPQPQPDFTFTAIACLPQARIDFTNTTPNISSWTYQWDFDNPGGAASSAVNPSYTYTVLGPHSVKLVATSATTSCTNSKIKSVNSIHPAPFASFDFNKPSICVDKDVSVLDHSTFADGTPASWIWNFGDNTGNASGQVQPAHTYSAPGTYNVKLTVTNNLGCVDDTTREFTVYPYPVVNAGADQYVLEGGTTTLLGTASGNELTYVWSPSTYLNNPAVPQPISTPGKDITYTLTVTAKGNCAKSDDVFVKVLKFPEIPNTFTPNNDGIHDTWEIKYLYTYPDNKVQVFTRTGQLVFESKGYRVPWNGTLNGKPLPFDTYYYIIEPGSGRQPITGYVTIVK